MNNEYFDEIAGSLGSFRKELYEVITQKKVPYHQWYKWIQKKLDEFYVSRGGKLKNSTVSKPKSCWSFF